MFEIQKRNNFNIPNNCFIGNPSYLCYSRVGGLYKNGYESPNGASSISTSKKLAFIKSHYEYLERRLLMTGHSIKNQYIETFNLITSTFEKKSNDLSKFSREGSQIIDTTGTATHYNSAVAIYNALKELLEKNALFLFWYGGIGKSLLVDESIKHNHYYKQLTGRHRQVKLFLSDVFYPLNVVFTIVFNKEDVYTCGIGAGINIKQAINHSLKEALLLKWSNMMNKEFGIFPNYVTIEKTTLRKRLNQLQDLPLYNYHNNTKGTKSRYPINQLVAKLPKWIKSLYVILLRNPQVTNAKTVKVFSYELYNHVPYKDAILLNRKINLNTINLTVEQLKKMPDTILI